MNSQSFRQSLATPNRTSVSLLYYVVVVAGGDSRAVAVVGAGAAVVVVVCVVLCVGQSLEKCYTHHHILSTSTVVVSLVQLHLL